MGDLNFFEKLEVELKNHVILEPPILGSELLSAIQTTGMVSRGISLEPPIPSTVHKPEVTQH